MRSPKSSKSSPKPYKQLSPGKSKTPQPISAIKANTRAKKHLHLNDTEAANKANSDPKNMFRRHSLFSSSTSPSARRRSFLSSSMINNENYLVYEISSYGYGYNQGNCELHSNDAIDSEDEDMETSSTEISNKRCTCSLRPRFSVSLNESQGFNWNQDLFASRYQQEQGAIYFDDALERSDNTIRTIPRSRVFSYSMSHDEGNMNKVDVIDIKVDEDDNKVGF